ncbi:MULTISPECIES: FTR1 family protein [unclassified Bradyrhizobium]|uniref:FTR1 family iron permease n=1 Tax=unclassified Bradyrhizobium TaxID=2631580 RepID=UPI001BAB8BE2|nr:MULTISPECIES: FTR1 family protein [unclassified Bradyrhizobium]MBR1225629.1 FTR1 family protein [Bradyrhizobium sp. AUGA SZCCT0176]MBR1298141.1 FTR1 family protein [Bradyrhizobium sp. AUGA SZCCT0042]
MSSAFIQAAVILLREGLEAMLVIAALAGYLKKVGSAHRVGALYGGALAAVGASFIAAWLFAVLNSGDHSDVLEGVIILFAAALMLYVSGWLMVKQDPRGWQDYLAHKADSALAQDTVWAVGALAFLAVFREGAETVLFINALAKTEGGWSAGLFGGLAAATVGLAVLFYFINMIAQKLPLRPLFVITSAFLFAMAIKFIGEAVQEFQEQAIITVTEVKGSAFFTAIGLNPSMEALSIQLLVILFALATFSVFQRNARLMREEKASVRAAE